MIGQFTGKAFVVFKTSKIADKVMSFERSNWQRFKRIFCRPRIKFTTSRAPEPRDIIWENMAITKA